MFWRYHVDGRATPVDLSGLYEGGALFIVCGSPSLKHENLDLLSEPGIVTLGINNASVVKRTNLWVGGDRPDCYSQRILNDPGILKFIHGGKVGNLINGLPWERLQGALVYECAEFTRYNFTNFLDHGPKFVWWKNTFFIALQLAWRLGFRRVYLVGAEFRISEGHQYAYPTALSGKEIKANSTVYSKSVEWMESLQPLFAKEGFAVMNTGEDSNLRAKYGYLSLAEAVNRETHMIPRDPGTQDLPHSTRI